MDGNDSHFLRELKSYAPIVLPALFIYSLESCASLKLWHAVQQTPYSTSSSSLDDGNSTDVAIVNKAIKKADRRNKVGSLLLVLGLLSIVVIRQFTEIRVSEDEGNVDGLGYYGTALEHFVRSDCYYPVTLFCPAVFLIARMINMLAGITSKVVFRDAKGVPFTVISKNEGIKLRFPILAMSLSMLIAIGAVKFDNSLCVAVFYMAIIHFLVSGVTVTKVVMFKMYSLSAFILSVSSISLFNLRYIAGKKEEYTGIFSTPSSEANWPALIISCMWSTVAYNFVSLCYRLDHAFAYPDELPSDLPFVGSAIRGAADARGIQITYDLPNVAGKPVSPRLRFAKPYFHAALGTWFGSYAILAASGVDAVHEMWGLYVIYISVPLITLAVIGVAVFRGEFRRVWAYKEEWNRDPAPATIGSAAATDIDLEAKQPAPFELVGEKVSLGT
ncbi:hypothetical protein M0805_004433 [Coniferiporia weirii]|nr:hypothetical protein M0805_004433 [Coniferiporia weirii]